MMDETVVLTEDLWQTSTDGKLLYTLLLDTHPQRGWLVGVRNEIEDLRFSTAFNRKCTLLALALLRYAAPNCRLTALDLQTLRPRVELCEWFIDNRGLKSPHLCVPTRGIKELKDHKYNLEYMSKIIGAEAPDWYPLTAGTVEVGSTAVGGSFITMLELGQISGREFWQLAREIFGNPLAKIRLERSVMEHIQDAAYPLALDMYKSRDFSLMPHLGKALRKLGCKQETILQHCESGTHYKGCWVVDLVLGIDPP